MMGAGTEASQGDFAGSQNHPGASLEGRPCMPTQDP